jgi:hypothetical protein
MRTGLGQILSGEKMLIVFFLLAACLEKQIECDTDSLDTDYQCEEFKSMGPDLPKSPK